jgi:hypothetical protein
MGRFNYFLAQAECPFCHWAGPLDFQSNVGVLDWTSYKVGESVLGSDSLNTKLPRGPSASCDYSRPHWSVGIGRCPQCGKQVTARIEVRDGVFNAAVVERDLTDLFAWGYLDDED